MDNSSPMVSKDNRGNLPMLVQAMTFLPFAYLWFRAIDSVQLEWSTNPQYSYGWIVPLLCCGLAFRNWTSLKDTTDEPLAFPRLMWLFFALGLMLFLPARLVSASTPEWRPLQWVLAIIAVVSTLFFVRYKWGRSGFLTFGFPVCFFLVAVPWPTPIEQPIIQSLTQANASVVVELMGILGIPAVQHGNLIEVGSGLVGIDEACSGIRSFQSSLMISLFLGEFYRLSRNRRIALLGSGIIVSFAFNVCRTGFLTWVAASKGVDAISEYHDPAGLVILVACTLVLWGLGLFLGRKSSLVSATMVQGARLRNVNENSPVTHNRLRPIALGLLVWIALVEIGVASWYSHRESKLAAGPEWTLAFPEEDSTFKPVKISEKTYGLLRYDEGKEGAWNGPDGANWHGFYFNWVPGRVAGYLAKRHTPEACMTGVGHQLLSGPDLFVAKIHDLNLPIRQYLFESQGTKIHVFHCRWEAGAGENSYVEQESSRLNLVRGIWAGRGKQGQKVIEFVVTGYETQEDARAALISQLERSVQLTPKKEVSAK